MIITIHRVKAPDESFKSVHSFLMVLTGNPLKPLFYETQGDKIQK